MRSQKEETVLFCDKQTANNFIASWNCFFRFEALCLESLFHGRPLFRGALPSTPSVYRPSSKDAFCLQALPSAPSVYRRSLIDALCSEALPHRRPLLTGPLPSTPSVQRPTFIDALCLEAHFHRRLLLTGALPSTPSVYRPFLRRPLFRGPLPSTPSVHRRSPIDALCLQAFSSTPSVQRPSPIDALCSEAHSLRRIRLEALCRRNHMTLPPPAPLDGDKGAGGVSPIHSRRRGKKSQSESLTGRCRRTRTAWRGAAPGWAGRDGKAFRGRWSSAFGPSPPPPPAAGRGPANPACVMRLICMFYSHTKTKWLFQPFSVIFMLFTGFFKGILGGLFSFFSWALPHW